MAADMSTSVVDALREYRQIHRGRVGGVQRDQRTGHRFRTLPVSGQMMATHKHATPLLCSDSPQ